MTNWIPLGEASEISPGNRKTYSIQGTEIAVFHVADNDQPGEFYAIHDCCPHQGASLVEGDGSGTEIACPLHDWTFDVASGECHDFPEFPLTCYELKLESGVILIDASTIEDLDVKKNLYLVRYGARGWIDHFSAEEDTIHTHRERVILKSSRGEELGEILSKAEESMSSASPAGSILRTFTPSINSHFLNRKT